MKVQYSHLVSSASGSAGGSTASRNRYGSYLRSRVMPINKKSPLQLIFRAIMATVAAAWNDLLDAGQRASWDVYADNVPVIDKLGVVQHVTGFNAFVGLNTSRVQAGLEMVLDGPAEFTQPIPDPTLAITATESGQALSVVFDNTMEWAGEVGAAMLIYAGLPQSPNRTFFDGPWKYAGKIVGAGTEPTSPATLTNPFEVSAGQKQTFYAKIVRADGRACKPFRCSDIVG